MKTSVFSVIFITISIFVIAIIATICHLWGIETKVSVVIVCGFIFEILYLLLKIKRETLDSVINMGIAILLFLVIFALGGFFSTSVLLIDINMTNYSFLLPVIIILGMFFGSTIFHLLKRLKEKW